MLPSFGITPAKGDWSWTVNFSKDMSYKLYEEMSVYIFYDPLDLTVQHVRAPSIDC